MSKLEALHDLLRNRSAAVGMLITVMILLVALIGPGLTPYDPNIPMPLDRLKGPSAAHYFGTDSLEIGRAHV